ncbi:MAG: hypothetical protein ACW963_10195 [Candidatus Sifarchaeia archaeon]|jgi:hypothetical protein
MPDIIAHFSDEVLNKLEVFVQQGIYTNVKELLRDVINYYLTRSRPELLASNEFYKNSQEFRLPEIELKKLVKIIFTNPSETKIEFEIEP